MNLSIKKSFNWALASLSLLLIPLLASLAFTDFNWKVSDFIIFGLLLFSFSFAIAWASRLVGSRKWLVIAAFILLFFLIWAELAVGLFGSPWAGS